MSEKITEGIIIYSGEKVWQWYLETVDRIMSSTHGDGAYSGWASLYALWKHPRKYTVMYALVVLLNPFKLTIDTGITTGNGDDKSQEASTAVWHSLSIAEPNATISVALSPSFGFDVHLMHAWRGGVVEGFLHYNYLMSFPWVSVGNSLTFYPSHF